MNRKLTSVLAFCLLASSLFAQNFLPRNLTPEEVFQLQTDPDLPGKPVAMGITTPPDGPVRAMAEWEESQALLITWNGQSTILTEIVRAARQEANVLIACNTQNVVTSAKNTLTAAGVDIASNVQFIVSPNNSIWVRDYGPNCVYRNDVDTMLIVDWIYNRPRPLDDAVPVAVGAALGVPVYSTTTFPYDLVHTGGNYMSDGMGMAFSSKLFLDENGPTGAQSPSKSHDEAECDSIMQQFMGIHAYPKMTALPYDVIHHIDMHMKLLDEETLLVGKYPAGIADGPQIEANIQYILSNFKTSFGTPFKVIRIPMPPEGTAYPHNGGDYRTYTNAVFVNKTVILPTYELKYDSTALRIWREAMPGYNVVGINCNSIIPSLGAIHCITHEIGVAEPLLIQHKKLEDVVDNNVPGYPVVASIKHRSGIQSASLSWATSPSGPWQTLDMASLSSQPDAWGAMIPVQPEGTTIYYYIGAQALSGKTAVRPMPAPAGWWKFKVPQSTATAEAARARLDDVYPNPARAITCVPVFCAKKTTGSVRLFDALGRLVETLHEGAMPAGASNYFFQADRLPAGAYFVEMMADGQREMRRVVVE